MEIREEYLRQAFKEAAIQQTIKDLVLKKYDVNREVRLGNRIADLVAKKGDQTIVFEFKASKWGAAKAKAVAQLRNYATHNLNGEFKLVFINPPQKKEINIDDIENILYQYMFEHMECVDQLATHVSIDEVSDVEIDTIDINSDEIEITGSGNATYDLQYGSDGDMSRGDGLQSTETYPFTFHIYLNHELEIGNVEELEVDTSSFYE